jgi:predicted nucleic acid-binding protein
MIVLDTNIVSELLRTNPDPVVLAWSLAVPNDAFVTTAVTEAELRLGVALLPPGRRRETLGAAMEAVFAHRFADRVLPFDRGAASHYAAFLAARRAAGRPAGQSDAMIAATARAAGASAIATRDTAGFEGCGLPLINPWLAA